LSAWIIIEALVSIDFLSEGLGCGMNTFNRFIPSFTAKTLKDPSKPPSGNLNVSLLV
jgi:hypothetical protein